MICMSTSKLNMRKSETVVFPFCNLKISSNWEVFKYSKKKSFPHNLPVILTESIFNVLDPSPLDYICNVYIEYISKRKQTVLKRKTCQSGIASFEVEWYAYVPEVVSRSLQDKTHKYHTLHIQCTLLYRKLCPTETVRSRNYEFTGCQRK